MTNVVRIRERAKKKFAQANGTKLTYMPFIFKATVDALKAHPKLNAAISGTDVVFKKSINLGMAVAMERGLIKHFYKRPHADQILVTFGLAIVLQEIVKILYGANPIPTPAPDALKGSFDFGLLLGFEANKIIYPLWRLVDFSFAAVVIFAVFAFLQFTTFGMVVRAGMADRETVGLLGVNIDRRFTIMFGLAAVVAGIAGGMYTPHVPPLRTSGNCSGALPLTLSMRSGQ